MTKGNGIYKFTLDRIIVSGFGGYQLWAETLWGSSIRDCAFEAPDGGNQTVAFLSNYCFQNVIERTLFRNMPSNQYGLRIHGYINTIISCGFEAINTAKPNAIGLGLESYGAGNVIGCNFEMIGTPNNGVGIQIGRINATVLPAYVSQANIIGNDFSKVGIGIEVGALYQNNDTILIENNYFRKTVGAECNISISKHDNNGYIVLTPYRTDTIDTGNRIRSFSPYVNSGTTTTVTNGDWEAKSKWENPTPEWSVWSHDISYLNGALAGLDFDVFDARPNLNWNGTYELYIDWLRFVSDTGTIRWLYNSTTQIEEEYQLVYDFLENTETDNLDGLPKKPKFVFNKNETVPPPSVSLMTTVSLVIRTVDLLGQSISDVKVEIKELGVSLTTDMDGLTSFDVPQGQWFVTISRNDAINEETIEVLLNTVSLQKLNLIKIDGLVLELWKFVLLGSVIIVAGVLLLILLHKKLIAGLMQP